MRSYHSFHATMVHPILIYLQPVAGQPHYILMLKFRCNPVRSGYVQITIRKQPGARTH